MNAEMLEKRREILQKINVLMDKCQCQTAMESNNCSNCKQIAKHGQRLLRLVNKRNTMILDRDDYAPYKSSKLPLTKEKYIALKNASKSDQEIAMMFNVAPGTIKNWKKLNNIKTERLKGRRYNVR